MSPAIKNVGLICLQSEEKGRECFEMFESNMLFLECYVNHTHLSIQQFLTHLTKWQINWKQFVIVKVVMFLEGMT